MNFKERYIEWVETELMSYLSNNYTLKVIEEATQNPYRKPPKNEIRVYVKFGSGSKQLNAIDRIDLPITIEALSESDSFDETLNILESFFKEYSKKLTVLKNVKELIDDEYQEVNFNVWHNYTTPIIKTAYQQIGTESRNILLMTGVLSYSKGQVLGNFCYLDDELVALVDPAATYQAEPAAFNSINKLSADTFIISSTNTYSARFLLTSSDVSLKLLSMAYNGFIIENGIKKKYEPTLKITYNTEKGKAIFEVECNISNIVIEQDSSNNDNIVNLVLTKKKGA